MEKEEEIESYKVSIAEPEDGSGKILLVSFLDGEGFLRQRRKLDRPNLAFLNIEPKDWEDDLTPWKSGKIYSKGKECGGKGDLFLSFILDKAIPYARTALSLPSSCSILVSGYSLAGLFALYISMKTDLFEKVAAVSPSFFYPGFTEYLKNNRCHAKEVYLSIGDKESLTRHPLLCQGEDKVLEVQKILNSQGVKATFEETRGNHFQDSIPRLNQGIVFLLKKKKKE
ncbi:MAG: hypothetical protein LKE52_03920 [Bacilli bacterium]|jgi:predicted alpha/beta superfamily hydrolase|nr:hypothetical protein [Bacilli bacterium]